jgi:hypothetical protein
VELIESGYGLVDDQPIPIVNTQPEVARPAPVLP